MRAVSELALRTGIALDLAARAVSREVVERNVKGMPDATVKATLRTPEVSAYLWKRGGE